jgi:hypothetical protein
MADETSQAPERSTEIWAVLDEAQQTVERWPVWQQRYRVDLYREEREAPHGS